MSVYVHIPFCRSKCVYCDFCSFAADESEMERYCRCLVLEMELAAAAYPGAEIDTVYIGGGTPSILPARLTRKVLDALRASFVIPRGIEFTSEANPGTITDEWLGVMAEAGMNRLSIGVQAKQDKLLRLLGRIHSFPKAEEALYMARKHGIQNLSADLMYGLPTQTLAEYLQSIRAVASLGVQHISAYALKVEEETKLHAMVGNGEAVLPDEDETADMMEAGIDLLESLGYRRYEISNFAKPGFESRHNLAYWRQRYYLGLGLDAAGMLSAGGAAYVRRTNTASLQEYCRLLSDGRWPIEESIPVSRDEAMFETVMLGLRTTDGVGYGEFQRMHGAELGDVFGAAIRELGEKGWLAIANPSNPRLALNRRGLAVQNAALMPFLEPVSGKTVAKESQK